MSEAAGSELPRIEPRRLERAAGRGSARAGLLVFIVCFVAYLAAIGLPATPGNELGARETRILLTTTSLLNDGDFELTNDYRSAGWRAFGGPPAKPAGLVIDGRLIEPHGFLFPTLLAPAYLIGGVTAVKLLLALITALGMVAAAALARRLVPDPWASGAAIAVGVSPPLVIAATTIRPAATCATVIAVAALLALRVRGTPGARNALGAGALLALIPWLGTIAILPAAVVAVALYRWLSRRAHGWVGLMALELVLVSVVFYISVNARIFGGLTPFAASSIKNPPTGAANVGDYIARLPRLAELFLAPKIGLLLVAPVLALAFVSVGLMWRSRKARLARALPIAADVEVAAGFFTAICIAAIVTAVLAVPSFGAMSPGEPLVVTLPVAAALASWGLRRYPRTGVALAAVGALLTVWLLIAGYAAADVGVAPLTGPLPWSVFGG
ncbi:MAG: hypothetical protein F2813_07535 [Actinobacteria bacterium]|uniref:Unannotated protein n=1 Tax=freshwater metagenome TaxID=449393 RepID=A0A6J6A1E5_9ZZZZ|nr:hypothetical protein [Actinomycetota bacterium]